MSEGMLAVIAVALLLGARHATEPDHLTAVATLGLDGEGRGPGRLALLGLAWGAGHGATLVLFGGPVVLLGVLLPDVLQRGIESLVGLLIVALAVRLLVRWRRGYFHVHPHRHADGWHAHPHVHEKAPEEPHPERHGHWHGDRLASPTASFGLGLVHGVGGSGAAALLLVGAQPTVVAATVTLLLFAGAAAVAMAAATGVFGFLLSQRPLAAHFERVVPVLGVGSLGFGAFYAFAAWA